MESKKHESPGVKVEVKIREEAGYTHFTAFVNRRQVEHKVLSNSDAVTVSFDRFAEDMLESWSSWALGIAKNPSPSKIERQMMKYISDLSIAMQKQELRKLFPGWMSLMIPKDSIGRREALESIFPDWRALLVQEAGAEAVEKFFPDWKSYLPHMSDPEKGNMVRLFPQWQTFWGNEKRTPGRPYNENKVPITDAIRAAKAEVGAVDAHLMREPSATYERETYAVESTKNGASMEYTLFRDGHSDVMLRTRDLIVSGIPQGGIRNIEYENHAITFAVGDMIFILSMEEALK